MEVTYDYYYAVKEDIRQFLYDNYMGTDDDETIRDVMWSDDTITGNGGMYYASEEDCQNYIAPNLGLLFEAMSMMGTQVNDVPEQNPAQWCDCLIRCYVFDLCYDQVLEEEREYNG